MAFLLRFLLSFWIFLHVLAGPEVDELYAELLAEADLPSLTAPMAAPVDASAASSEVTGASPASLVPPLPNETAAPATPTLGRKPKVRPGPTNLLHELLHGPPTITAAAEDTGHEGLSDPSPADGATMLSGPPAEIFLGYTVNTEGETGEAWAPDDTMVDVMLDSPDSELEELPTLQAQPITGSGSEAGSAVPTTRSVSVQAEGSAIDDAIQMPLNHLAPLSSDWTAWPKVIGTPLLAIHTPPVQDMEKLFGSTSDSTSSSDTDSDQANLERRLDVAVEEDRITMHCPEVRTSRGEPAMLVAQLILHAWHRIAHLTSGSSTSVPCPDATSLSTSTYLPCEGNDSSPSVTATGYAEERHVRPRLQDTHTNTQHAAAMMRPGTTARMYEHMPGCCLPLGVQIDDALSALPAAERDRTVPSIRDVLQRRPTTDHISSNLGTCPVNHHQQDGPGNSQISRFT
ncbi:unnamed protein product [Symbiodinium natans]|uniref:Uncharacterized protein n=1 Tax=Symbiodinium natans TaxID=878477 RepID=A0A812JAF5_9DINO|nr:unnamed protein product [Symbiodinium natans]